MAITKDELRVLKLLDDLTKGQKSSVVESLKAKQQAAQNDLKTANESLGKVEEEISATTAKKEALSSDLAGLNKVLDPKAFAAFEGSLETLGLKDTLQKLFGLLEKAPNKVTALEDLLKSLEAQKEEHKKAVEEAGITISAIETTVPSVLNDLEALKSLLKSAQKNDVGNITKNEIIGHLTNINASCPDTFAKEDMEHIAQFILFPEKTYIEYKKKQKEEAMKAEAAEPKAEEPKEVVPSQSVREVLAAAKVHAEEEATVESAPVFFFEETAPVVEETVEAPNMQDAIRAELKEAGLEADAFTVEELDAIEETYHTGIIRDNVEALRDNLISVDVVYGCVDVLTTSNLRDKISTILDRGKTIKDIMLTPKALLTPVEVLAQEVSDVTPLWVVADETYRNNAHDNLVTLQMSDTDDQRRYTPELALIPNHLLTANIGVFTDYQVSMEKTNKKPAYRSLLQSTEDLQRKMEQAMEQGTLQHIVDNPESLAANEAEDIDLTELMDYNPAGFTQGGAF